MTLPDHGSFIGFALPLYVLYKSNRPDLCMFKTYLQEDWPLGLLGEFAKTWTIKLTLLLFKRLIKPWHWLGKMARILLGRWSLTTSILGFPYLVELNAWCTQVLWMCESWGQLVSMTVGIFFYFTVLSKISFLSKNNLLFYERHFWQTLMAQMFGSYLVSRLGRAWQSGPDNKEQTNKPLPF